MRLDFGKRIQFLILAPAFVVVALSIGAGTAAIFGLAGSLIRLRASADLNNEILYLLIAAAGFIGLCASGSYILRPHFIWQRALRKRELQWGLIFGIAGWLGFLRVEVTSIVQSGVPGEGGGAIVVWAAMAGLPAVLAIFQLLRLTLSNHAAERRAAFFLRRHHGRRSGSL